MGGQAIRSLLARNGIPSAFRESGTALANDALTYIAEAWGVPTSLADDADRSFDLLVIGGGGDARVLFVSLAFLSAAGFLGCGVAIGPRTRELLPQARTESLGPVSLKGKADPVEVYRLLELRA